MIRFQPYNRHRLNEKLWQLAVHTVLVLLALVFVMPFILVLSASLSENQAILLGGYRLWPVGLSLDAYRFILINPKQLLTSYYISLIVTSVGTVGGLLTSAMLAYVLSRPLFRLRNIFSFLVFFTILFNGGIVPLYLLMVRYLRLRDTIPAMILPYFVVPWYVLILRTYFRGLPDELLDAAKIDGAGEFRIFFQFVFPLSLPAFATIGLFYVLLYWNDWLTPLLFISKPNLTPLQYLLHRIMADLVFLTDTMGRMPGALVPPPLPLATIRMALAVLGAAPICIIFLSLQKYFVRGLTIGALKG